MSYSGVCAVDVHARCEAGGGAAQSAGQRSVQGGSAGECLSSPYISFPLLGCITLFSRNTGVVIVYSTVQYSTVQYSTVQYSTVQYSTVQYSTVQYSTDPVSFRVLGVMKVMLHYFILLFLIKFAVS